MIFLYAHTQEREGLDTPWSERHVHLFEVRTRTYVRTPEAFWVFITRENASLARSITLYEGKFIRKFGLCVHIILKFRRFISISAHYYTAKPLYHIIHTYTSIGLKLDCSNLHACNSGQVIILSQISSPLALIENELLSYSITL